MSKLVLMLVLCSIALTAPAHAEVFDIPANGSWVKVQDAEITQWSVISAHEPRTRIDLVSYIEAGKRVTYYLIRSQCADGTITSAVIGAGKKVGIGLDCNGHTITRTTSILYKVRQLPAEAARLLK